MSARLLPAALLALLIAYLLIRAAVPASLTLAAACAALAYVVTAAGRLLHRGEADPCASYTLGLLCVCLAVYGLTLALPVSALAAFAIVAVPVAGADWLRRRRSLPRPDWRAMAGFALAIALTAAWCGSPADASRSVSSGGVLTAWSDYFFHGGLISQFGDPRAVGRGSIYLADHPASFYHFASYAAAAALAGALDQPGLPLALAAWLPLGFLAMLGGAHTLGVRLAGPAGGIAALIAVAALPDASNYWLRNGWFSFHFTLIAHAGATYALGAAFLSLALLERWSSERAPGALLASALLAASALFFRAHVFALLLPCWLAAAAFCSTRGAAARRRVGWAMIGLLGIGAVVASLAIAQLADAGYWRFHGGPALGRFLTIVHNQQEPTAYTDVYRLLWSLEEATTFALGIGIALAVVAALGAFVLLLPVAARLAGALGQLRPIDAACGYLVFSWLLLMLFAPEPWHGDATDLIHRPFVLLYTAAGIWTLCLLLRVLGEARAPRRHFSAMLLAAVLALPAVLVTAGQMQRPKFRWGEFDYSVRVPDGLVAAARFLRSHGNPGDIFAAAGLHARYATFDVSTQFCSLSGVPAFLSRPYYESIKDGPRKAVVMQRLEAVNRIDTELDYARAMESLERLGVQWFLVAGEQGPRWDPNRERAAFSAGSVALYAAPGAASGRALHDQMGVRNADQVVAHDAAHAGEFVAREPLVSVPLAHVPAAIE